MEEHLLNIKELAQYLNVKVKAIYNMVYEKRIPKIKVGKLLRFNKTQIDAWLKLNTTVPFGMEKCYNANQVEGEETKK
ncbi:MAG: helix-turn-helix domain-containing protein [Elusimicrobia bacterium]|nr:helix-turn-helix domain-containing protein [Candidatus Liberimonas magnetica]